MLEVNRVPQGLISQVPAPPAADYFQITRSSTDRPGRREIREIVAEYAVDDAPIARVTGAPIPPGAVDLIDVVCAVHNVDKLLPTTSSAKDGDALSRHRGRRLHQQLEVRRPEAWRAQNVDEMLRYLLDELTGDTWTFEFSHRPRGTRYGEALAALSDRRGLALDGTPVVCLFSGGLDALAGVASILGGSESASISGSEPIYLVSVETNRPIGAVQRRLVEGVRRAYPDRDIRHVSLPALLVSRATRGEDGRSARTRGLLFLSVGLVVALLAGTTTLRVFENGVGAINLPFHRGQVGADNSRSVHPGTLLQVASLASAVLEPSSEFRVVNPCIGMTKGRMCTEIIAAGLSDLVPLSVSCDSYPRHIAGAEHCGLCTSCLLRRLSLHAAGLVDEDRLTGYRDDVLHDPERLLRQPKQLYPIRGMEQQIAALAQCLAHMGREEAWEALERCYPQLADVVEILVMGTQTPRDQVRHSLVGLYATYVEEWRAFATPFSGALFGAQADDRASIRVPAAQAA